MEIRMYLLSYLNIVYPCLKIIIKAILYPMSSQDKHIEVLQNSQNLKLKTNKITTVWSIMVTTGEFYFENLSCMLDKAGNSHALDFVKKRFDSWIS